MLVLRLNKSGMPQDWISLEEAARYYCQERVLFELGSVTTELRGGLNKCGQQSKLRLSSIIACDGKVVTPSGKIPLCNRYLFRRDGHICLYCGKKFPASVLTRDHVIPKSRGGQNTWSNTVTACARCNHYKGARTPEEAGMALLAIPFVPNIYEHFYLRNRKILADQMQFLSGHFSSKRSWQQLDI